MRFPPQGVHVRFPPGDTQFMSPPGDAHVLYPPGMLPLFVERVFFSSPGDKRVLVELILFGWDSNKMCRRFLTGDASPSYVTASKTVTHRPHRLPVRP